jgi:hypothetical protein
VKGSGANTRLHVNGVSHSGASGGLAGDGVDEVVPRDTRVADHFPDVSRDTSLDNFPEAPNRGQHTSHVAMFVVGMRFASDEVASKVAVRDEVSGPGGVLDVEQIEVSLYVGESNAEGVELADGVSSMAEGSG